MYQKNKTLLTTQQEAWSWKTSVVGSRGLPFYMKGRHPGLQKVASAWVIAVKKVNKSCLIQRKQSLSLFDIQRFSSWRRLLGVTAWILKFIFKSKRTRHQKKPRDRRQAQRLNGKSPRNWKRAPFRGIDNLERMRKCLEKQSALDIVTIKICGQWWNLTCRWETRNVQSTLQCQTPSHITEETHLKTCYRPHP